MATSVSSIRHIERSLEQGAQLVTYMGLNRLYLRSPGTSFNDDVMIVETVDVSIEPLVRKKFAERIIPMINAERKPRGTIQKFSDLWYKQTG